MASLQFKSIGGMFQAEMTSGSKNNLQFLVKMHSMSNTTVCSCQAQHLFLQLMPLTQLQDVCVIMCLCLMQDLTMC